MDNSRELFNTVQGHLGNDADFLGDLDLPMQIISGAAREGQLLRLTTRHSLVEINKCDMDDDLMEADYDEA
jgi:hypothetical protein